MDPSLFQPSPLTQATDQKRPLGEGREIIGDQPKPSMPMTSDNVQSNGGGDAATGTRVKYPFRAGLRSWSFGLFDCFSDLPTCALSTCCCCYVYSRNKLRFEHLEKHGVPLRKPVKRCNHDCGSFFNLQAHLGAGWGLQAISRYDVRRRYGIRGDAVNDVLTSYCLLPCGLVQTHREIQLEESSFS